MSEWSSLEPPDTSQTSVGVLSMCVCMSMRVYTNICVCELHVCTAVFHIWSCLALWCNQVGHSKAFLKGLVAQSCLTLCEPMDCSLPDSSFHGILQARILELAAISSSRDLSYSVIEPLSPALAGGLFTTEPPGKPS